MSGIPLLPRSTSAVLCDYLVSPLQDGRRDGEAERDGGAHVEDAFEPHRLPKGMSAGLAPFRILSSR